jgi:putative inorganic carbon (HCO3(-)) transporter
MNLEIVQHLFLGLCFAFLLLSIWRPYFGLLAYTVLYFLRVGEVYPFLGTIRFEFIVGAYLVARICIQGIPTTARLNANPTTKALAVFLIIIFLSVPFAVSFSTSWEWATYYLKRFIFAFMALVTIDTRGRLRGFFWVFSLMTCWVALEPFLNYMNGQAFVAQDVYRISAATGYFHNPNTLAGVTAQTLPLLWGLAVSARRKSMKALIALLGIFCVTTVIMTGSRGGFLGMATVVLVLAWLSKNRARSLAVSATVFLLILALMGSQYRARQATTLELGQSDYSARSRIAGLVHGFSMMVKRPILGVGIGCYPVARRQWFGWSLWAHNHYGQLMGELGLAGIIVWTWLIVSIFRNLSRVKLLCLREQIDPPHELAVYATALQTLFLMRLAMGMTGHSLYSESWYLFGAVSVQLLALAESRQANATGRLAADAGQAEGEVSTAMEKLPQESHI